MQTQTTFEPEVIALARHLNLDDDFLEEISDAEATQYGPYGYGVSFEYDGAEYAVLDEEDADLAWEESLDSYIDECILPELPEHVQQYFDSDKWKQDAKFDGRGHALSSYDGNEHEVKVGEHWFYIYRTN